MENVRCLNDVIVVVKGVKIQILEGKLDLGDEVGDSHHVATRFGSKLEENRCGIRHKVDVFLLYRHVEGV